VTPSVAAPSGTSSSDATEKDNLGLRAILPAVFLHVKHCCALRIRQADFQSIDESYWTQKGHS